MGIPLLQEIQTELVRLAAAGSSMAFDDYKLKSLVPAVKKMAAGVPVFGRVAADLEKLLTADKDIAGENLLELAALVYAILYTQGETGAPGATMELLTYPIPLSTVLPYRRLKPIIEALTTTGPGRLEILYTADQEKLFYDSRLLPHLVYALDDRYPDIVRLVFKILSEMDRSITPILKDTFQVTGSRRDARILELIGLLTKHQEAALFLEALEKGTTEVKAGALLALKNVPNQEALVVEYSLDSKKDIREAAYETLAHYATPAALKRLLDAFLGKDMDITFHPILRLKEKIDIIPLVTKGEELIDMLKTSKKLSTADVQRFNSIYCILKDNKEKAGRQFIKLCESRKKELNNTGIYLR